MLHWIKLLILLLIPIAVVMFFLSSHKQPLPSSISDTEQAQTTLMLLPSPLDTTESGTMDIVMDTHTNTVRFVQIKLSFDPKHLTHIRITKGKFMQQAEVLNEFVDHNGGTLTYILAIPKGKNMVTGKGTIATITFKTLLEQGQKTVVAFAKETLVTNDSSPGSLLKKTLGTTIVRK